MTTDHEATRTLVKSPPELWAECSDADSLARHIDGSFGEIRITRLEPETTVAWEGERVSGTIRIEPAGWGTRVTLTAQTEAEQPTAEEPTAEEPMAEDPTAEDPPPAEPAAEEPPPAPPVAEEPAVPVPAALTPRGGLWDRLRLRFLGPAPPSPGPEPGAPEPEPEPKPAAPAPPPEAAEPPPPQPAPLVEEPVSEALPGEPAARDATAVLTAALDSLGQAHHRPFSRG